jgi:hypothetical protein
LVKPNPSPVSIRDLKTKILRPATTSHFQCWFPPPINVINWFKSKNASRFSFDWNAVTQELISFNCIEASLPGSTLATTEINDDYTGVTERIPYRRLYDDRADFTFIVDNSFNGNNSSHYRVLKFFELWTEYIADEQISGGVNDPNYFYRMNYPDDYMAPYIIIDKFEKDYRALLRYKFLNAYPLVINSMPVSYESTQVLQCTISFSYIRYVIEAPPSSEFKELPTPNTPYIVSNSNRSAPPPPPPTIPAPPLPPT